MEKFFLVYRKYRMGTMICAFCAGLNLPFALMGELFNLFTFVWCVGCAFLCYKIGA